MQQVTAWVRDFVFNRTDVQPEDFAGHSSAAKGIQEMEEDRRIYIITDPATAGPGPTLGWLIASLAFHTHTHVHMYTHAQMCLDPNDMIWSLPEPYSDLMRRDGKRETDRGMNRGSESEDMEMNGKWRILRDARSREGQRELLRLLYTEGWREDKEEI